MNQNKEPFSNEELLELPGKFIGYISYTDGVSDRSIQDILEISDEQFKYLEKYINKWREE